MIDHRHALALAATALDFPLDASDRDILEAHVRECAACRAELAAYHRDAARLAALPPIAPPARVRGAIGRAHPVHRFVLLAAAALLFTASAGIALVVGSALRDARIPDVSPAPSTPARSSAEPTAAASIATVTASPVEAPSKLEVACDGTRADIPTPLVRAQADGIHIHFANTSGHELAFGIEDATGLALLGDSIPVVGGTFVYTFGPGSYQLTCGGTTASPFAVVDPDGLYAASEVGCAGGTTDSSDFVAGARGPRGSLLDVARTELRGLQPGDVVEHAGYPQAAGDQFVRVVRHGEVVAVLGYADDGHGGWLLGGTRACPGSNITTVLPKG
jgi:hypothetical protein